MKGVTPLLCAVFCVMIIVLAAVPKTRAYAIETAYTVGIHEDGTASWVIEQSAYLETEADKTSFEQLISSAMVNEDQFASNVSTIIDQAYARTGRFMTAENITVGGNVTESGAGAYGFLEYSFDWTNFAPVGNTNITIGDGFSNESFMFGDGGLSILLPIGYSVKSCSPSPDYESNGLLEWNSVSDLQNGQPTVLLSGTPPTIVVLSPGNKTYSVSHVLLNFTISEQVSWEGYSLDGSGNVTIAGNTTLINLSDASHTITVYANDTVGNMGSSNTINFAVDATEGTSFFPASPVFFEVMLPLAGAVLASALILRTRKKKKERTLETFPDEAIKEGGDTERILALLRKEGGQMLQSKITDQLRFSKAKTSMILGDMERKGFIKRHKSGRDKVVSLQKEPEKARS